ncbi:hypothetical protein [Paraflavitalea speifideaquila]|uniref:hypothetical protein n=1 Tax=Paraflavitalea speifideaquila TaxID=3076558 RepID=UPI0028E195C2|nr:hypothetical protein [Paraflavitalea speifideiaquila]
MKPIFVSYGLILLLLGNTPNAEAQKQVYLSPGLYLIALDAPRLVFQNLDLNNNGHFTADNSTVIFTDHLNQRPALINGNSKTAFHHLTINQPIQLAHDIQVTGNLLLNQGNLQLDHYTLDLDSSGNIIGERNESHIIGRSGSSITRTAVLQAPQQVNPGNIGVSITSPANLGLTRIIRGHNTPVPTSSSAATNRTFDIQPANNKNLQATLQFHYLDAELSGNENELTLFTGDGYNWKAAGKDKSNAAANWLIKNKLDQLHRYTLAGNGFAKMQVYPNPVKNRFTLTWQSTARQEIVLLLTDASGKIMERKNKTAAKASIPSNGI